MALTMTRRSDAIGFSINQKYIEELASFYEGNAPMMLTASINAYIAILSEIYEGNHTAVADRFEATSAGIIELLRSMAVPLARGTRH